MKRKKDEGDCVDCGKDTYEDPKDYYMVTCDIWNIYGLGGSIQHDNGGWSGNDSGMLCIECLETRMGRKLEKKDLMDCKLNKRNPYTKELK